MFRKYYTDANNDIKPSEEFVSSVIENTHKKPPVKRLYVRYTATAAAAVIMVSAAMLSMPLWQNVTDNDGVITTETMSPDTTDSPQSTPALSDENTVVHDNNADKSAADNNSDNVSVRDYKNSQKSDVSPAAAVPKKNTVTENTKIPDTNETARAAENIPSQESVQTEENTEVENKVFQDVQESTDAAELPPRTPPPSVSNAKKPPELSYYSFHDDPSFPTPDGYHCVSTSPNGYTFASEDGAVIVVEISYGTNEESEPYYSTDGDSIFASFSSYGMTVTVRSTGADMSTIEEIINTLR